MIKRRDRKTIKTLKNKTLICFMLFVLLSLFCFPLIAEDDGLSIKDYDGKPIGVLVGPLTEGIADEFFPNSEHLLLNSYPDCVTALLTHKIDGYLADEPGLKMVCAEQPEITYLPEKMMENSYSFAFRKNDEKAAALCAEFNEFISQCKIDGSLKEIDEIWFGSDEERKIVDMTDLKKDGRIIRVATTSTDIPFSYIKDGSHVGYDIDVAVRFCRSKGYGLEITDVDFAGRIPEIESGKCDFTTAMNVTPERQEQVLFSEPVSSGGIVLAIRKSDLQEARTQKAASIFDSVDDLAGKRIGVMSGAVHDQLVEKRLPTAEIMYFNSFADMTAALKAGQIDAFVALRSAATFMRYEDESLTWLDEHLRDGPIAAAFAKNEEGRRLNEEFSSFIRKIRDEGTLDELTDKWFAADEQLKTIVDYDTLKDINGTLVVATAARQVPYSYVRDGEVVGLDMEIVAKFCEEYGYGLRFEQISFDGILAAVQTGKCDFAASCIAVTEERKESVDFSEVYADEASVIVTLSKDTISEEGNFFQRIANSFYKTFIRESRWKLFLEGIATTLLITVLTIIFGTALGFILFLLCRNGGTIANTVTKASLWLVQGTPMVVLLMVLYYIVFASVAISGIAVAVIGFTLTFGGSVYGLIRMAVGTIDKGQYEAAYALGHNKRQTFFRIILPQAIPHVLPAYQGEITGLIKATAVVGYIAVQDLTKMGDIVRSRTYEAFFPLIAITVIYLLLETLFGFFGTFLETAFDPRRHKRHDLLKGVQFHDQD